MAAAIVKKVIFLSLNFSLPSMSLTKLKCILSVYAYAQLKGIGITSRITYFLLSEDVVL